MFGTVVFASATEDEAPNNPVMRVFWLLLHTFADLLYCFDHIAFFELSESPVHVRVVLFGVELLSLSTDVEGFFVYHVHVEQEC